MELSDWIGFGAFGIAREGFVSFVVFGYLNSRPRIFPIALHLFFSSRLAQRSKVGRTVYLEAHLIVRPPNLPLRSNGPPHSALLPISLLFPSPRIPRYKRSDSSFSLHFAFRGGSQRGKRFKRSDEFGDFDEGGNWVESCEGDGRGL